MRIFLCRRSSSALDYAERTIELRASGEEVFAIGEGPAVILNVSELDARGAGSFGDLEHFFDLVDVAAVDYEVQGDRYADVFSHSKTRSFCAWDLVLEISWAVTSRAAWKLS